MKFGKGLILCALIGGAGYLSGCGDDRETLTAALDWDFGTTLGYSPFERGEEDHVVGFDIDVLHELAFRLRFRRLDCKEVPFHEIIKQTVNGAAVNGNHVNLGISAISITNARKNTQDPNGGGGNQAFIKYNDDTMAVILEKDKVDADSLLQDPDTVLERLNQEAPADPGTFLGTTSAARHVAILEDPLYSSLKPNPVDGGTLNQAIDQLFSGSVINEGIFTDEPTAHAILSTINTDTNNTKGKFTVVAPVPVDIQRTNSLLGQVSDGLGIVVNKNCCQLYVDIAQAIKDMEADGTLPQLREKWNVGTFTPVDLTPAECRGVTPNVNNNQIALFLFRKQCNRFIPGDAISK